MYVRITVLIFFVWITLSPAGSAPPVVKGTVTDASNHNPLPGANVIYAPGQGTVTNEWGIYQLRLQPGQFTLQFRFIGYQSIQRQISLSAGDTLTLDISLDPEVTRLNQVIVSASRVEQRVAESTVSVSLIRPQDYNAAQITSASELVNKTPGIEVLDGQASIRGGSGFSYGAGSRVLTLVDGLPILAADAGSIRWQFLPLENISQIEIIKGASSVLYGSSALNGIINFRTAPATEEGRTSFYIESGMFGNPSNKNWKWWSSPRNFSSASFSHLKRYGQTEVALGSFLLVDQGYRRLNNENLGRVNLNLRHHHRTIQGLSYGINTLVGYSDKRDFVLWEDADRGALRQAESTAINLNGTFVTVDPFIRLRYSSRASHDLRNRVQFSRNRYPDSESTNSDALSIYSEYQSWYEVNPYLSVNSGILQKSTRVWSQFYGDHEALNLAAYMQADVSPLERLKLVGGVRLEHNTLNGERDRLVALFRAGMNYQLQKFTFLRASWGQGYRYPSIAEKHAATALGAVRIFPNPFLEAESGWNSEIGIKQGVGIHKWDGLLDIALFYSQNKDLIEYMFGIYQDPQTGLGEFGFRATNTEYSRVYGVETEFILSRTIGQFENNISGGYVFMYPVEFNPRTGKNTGTFLKYRRNHSAKLSLGTVYRNFRLGTDLFYRSRIQNIDDVFLDELTRETILPGFYDYWNSNNTGHFIMDLNMGWQFHRNYEISMVLKNLTNTEYMGRPGDIQPHRRFSLRLSINF
ncbi:MAG: TonB-dependent receptor [Bacteroidetes bacterium]|nr:MAG: TonB-dependent receptor [Bacteroidota bacterium]